jgi:hypothetical protein
MKRMFVLILALLLVASTATVASAGDNSKVEYTWTLSDLGQGVWGGGPLYADGSAAGNLAFSGFNGGLVFHLHPTSWHEVVPGKVVDICFTLHEIKGETGFPPAYCLSDVGVLLPVTGTPIIIPNPDVPDLQLLMRVTPTN